MRVAGKAAVAALAALIIGLIVSFAAAAWLRSAAPSADVVWRSAKPGQVAVWTLAGAHGAPLHVSAGASLQGDIGDTIGGLIGRQPEIGTRDLFVIRLAPLVVLLVIGLVLGYAMRASGARTISEAITGSVVAGAIYGVTLAGLAAAAHAKTGVDTSIVRAGIEVSVPAGAALVGGVFWSAVFAFFGAVSTPDLSAALAPVLRAIGGGLKRAALVAGVASTIGIVVLALSHAGSSHIGGSPKLHMLGAVLLSMNFVAAGAILSHGAAMHAAFNAGPLAKFSSIGYMTSALGPQRWLMVLVPIAAGMAAGRAMRKRAPDADMTTLALGFGAAWGVALTVVAIMLRVKMVTLFSIGSGDAGGTATISPLIVLATGFGWGTALSYLGMSTVTVDERLTTVEAVVPEQLEAADCTHCGAPIPFGDKFCGSCGAPR